MRAVQRGSRRGDLCEECTKAGTGLVHTSTHWIGAQRTHKHTLALIHWHTSTLAYWYRCTIVLMQYETELRLAHSIGADIGTGTMAGTTAQVHTTGLH